MSTSYLQAYENIIPQAQQQRLLAVLSINTAAAGISTNQATLQTQIGALIAKLEVPLGSPQVQYRPAAMYSKISSNDYNVTMQETFVDLGAIFAQDNIIDSAQSVHRNLNIAAITDSQAALNTVANDVAVYQIVNNNNDGINSAIFNNFYKNDNTYIDPIYETYLDTDTNTITLPQGTVNDALSINGLAMANITTTTYGGGIKGILSNNQATPSKAIDGSSSTFWAEVIMSSQPISQIYQSSSILVDGLFNYWNDASHLRFWGNGSYGNTYGGYLTQVTTPAYGGSTYSVMFTSQVNNAYFDQSYSGGHAYTGQEIIYSVWVNSSSSSAFISLAGRTTYHPGDGQWHLLSITCPFQNPLVFYCGVSTLGNTAYFSNATANVFTPNSTVFGPICEVVISLYRIELINYVRFNPFSRFPLSVLYINYRSNTNDPWINLNITPQTSTSVMDFYFNNVAVKELQIVINQESPSVNTYQIPQSQINNSLLWQQITNDELSIVDNAAPQTSSVQDMLDYNPGWQAFVDANQGFENNLINIGYPDNYINTQDITPSIFKAATQQITATTDMGAQTLSVQLYNQSATGNNNLVTARMYEYVYGAYDIDVQKIWYVDTGVYVSPVYASPGTVVEAELDTSDYAPPDSTIEYQLSTRSGEWYNIVPNGGSAEILGERLIPSPLNLEASLRFWASGVPSAVYINGLTLPSSEYSWSASANSITLNSSTYIEESSYTIDYVPSSGVIQTGSVSFLNDPLISEEQITTGQPSDQYKVVTDFYPFINYAIINDTINSGNESPDFVYTGGRWYNQTRSTVQGISPSGYYDVLLVTVNGYSAENMTDYYSGERPALTQYNSVSYPYYNYFQDESNLYFNTLVNGLEFKIVYQYLNEWIQLRATLRNNLASNVTQTPFVKSYTIKLRTI